ncbi:MAG TPA: hypothetical protein PKK85_09685 [Methanobacteriaceae archaeon]|nr:hypothetical protein [Methanobacteriaceae archaeon]
MADKKKMTQTSRHHWEKRGFSLHDHPPRVEVLKRNLKHAERELSQVKKSLPRVEAWVRAGVDPLVGPSYDIQLDNLLTKRLNLEAVIRSLQVELMAIEETK